MAIQQTGRRSPAQRQAHPWDKRQTPCDVTRGQLHGSSVFEGIRCYSRFQRASHFPRQRTHPAAHRFGQRFIRIDVASTRDESVAGMVRDNQNNGVWPCYIPSDHPARMRRGGINPFNSPIPRSVCNYPGNILAAMLNGASMFVFLPGRASLERCQQWRSRARTT